MRTPQELSRLLFSTVEFDMFAFFSSFLAKKAGYSGEKVQLGEYFP
jgi:hypothetical protein